MKPRKLSIALLSVLAVTAAACSKEGEKQGGMQMPPPSVGVIEMKQQTLPITTTLPARAVAYRSAEIVPQVSGIIEEKAFTDGATVKKGDLLYQIEKDSYQAALDQAKATLAKANATVPGMKANYERYKNIVNKGATEIQLTDAQVSYEQSLADVEAGKASVAAAQVNLDHTSIYAPFDGALGVSNIAIGNIASSSSTTPLVQINQLDPVYVDMYESASEVLSGTSKYSSSLGSEADLSKVTVTVQLDDGTEYDVKGHLDVSDRTVNESTGTVNLRAVFDNPKNVILPGMFVRATLTLDETQGYLIPQRAAQIEPGGKVTAQFVGKDNAVETRVFKDAQSSGNGWLVTSGVSDGDKLIVDGFQRLVGGVKTVNPVPVTINDDGVVVDQQPADASGGSSNKNAASSGSNG